MSNEIKKSKKLTFDDEEVQPAPKSEVLEGTEPVETPAVEVDDPEPGLEPAKEEPEVKETIIAQPLKTVEDIKSEYAKMSKDQYGDSFVQPDGPVIPEVFDLRAEITKILVPNTDEDMPKTLVKFDGMDTNYYLVDCHPARVYKAWQLYAQKEGTIPGKFMEMLFSVLNVSSKRYFHKVSTVELR